MKAIFRIFYIFTIPAHMTFAKPLTDSTNFTVPDIPSVNTNSDLILNKTDKYTQLFLNVVINNNTGSDLLSVKQDSESQLYILAKDLRSIRIKLPDSTPDDSLICLKDLTGISYNYDQNQQILKLDVALSQLDSYVVNLNGQDITNDKLLKSRPLNAAILNYNLYNTLTENQNSFSASADAIFNSQIGTFSSGFLYNNDHKTSYKHDSLVRLQSKWQYIDPIKIRLYTIGDFISNSPDWGNSVYLAGIQWSSAYTQRADIITSALPQFSGSAALPSSLDLFVNQQKIYSGLIPSGPFDLKQLPYISGNQVTLVTTDATGQQTITKKAYYFSPKVLAKGINEFSVDLGVPRYNYGTFSNDYDHNVLFGSGVIRYGYSQTLTLSGALEATTDSLNNAGAGFAKNIFGIAVVNADFAASKYKNSTGYSTLIGFEGRISKDISFNSSYQHRFDNYYDLARVSDIRYQKQYYVDQLNSDELLSYSAFANEIIRAGLSYNFLSGYGLFVGYNQLRYQDNTNTLLSSNFNASISKNWSLYASAYKDFDQNHNYGVYVALRYTPSTKFNATSSISNDSGNTSYRQEVNGLTTDRIGALGWGASTEHIENGQNNSSAYITYRSRPAYLTARYSQYADINQTAISASGSLVAAAGRVFAANEIGDGYAIITNAGPKSQILNGGVNLGSTDRKGRFLISNLIPYQVHHLFVDPTYLPLNWDVNSTEKITVTGFRQGTLVDFGARQVVSGLVKIVDQNQKPIATGYEVNVNQQQMAIVGYDGEVYVQNLSKMNTLKIDLLDKGTCTVHFDYQPDIVTTKKLGPFICQ
nr:fimbria/pilus outer membrane usher protein [Acinetobacter sp. Marseille-Q1620]